MNNDSLIYSLRSSEAIETSDINVIIENGEIKDVNVVKSRS